MSRLGGTAKLAEKTGLERAEISELEVLLQFSKFRGEAPFYAVAAMKTRFAR